METSVAAPTVILDTPSGTGEEGEKEGEGGGDDDYIVGNSTTLAPPTNEKAGILPAPDAITDQPEGECTRPLVHLSECDYFMTRSTHKDHSGYKGTSGGGRRKGRGRGRGGRDPWNHHTISA